MSSDSDASSAARSEGALNREVRKSPETILAQEIEEGLSELNRPTSGLFLSGLSAGLDIGFGPLLMAVVLTQSHGGLPTPILELLIAVAYAVGFVFVILGQSALFTEQTTLAVLPVIHGRAGYRQLGRVWGVVYASNVVGAALFAGFAVLVGTGTKVVEPAVFGEIARGLVAYRWWATLFSGVLAGWLMGLLSWLVSATRDTVSLLLVVLFVTGAIGFAHLPHSIAGTVEVLFGVFAGSVGVRQFGVFLLWSTLGNVVGSVVFVAVLKYSYVQRGESGSDRVEVSDD